MKSYSIPLNHKNPPFSGEPTVKSGLGLSCGLRLWRQRVAGAEEGPVHRERSARAISTFEAFKLTWLIGYGNSEPSH